ncbi:MAG TPA: hypothetical protein DCP08_06520 [Chloroflexi bacterium]|nr:hypothetical protein [Chloroflexota bacterium]
MASIRFPRRLDFGFRPYKGLTLRQVLWLVSSFSIAGILVLSHLGGAPMWVKLAIGGTVVGAGLVIAFMPLWGKPLDSWVPILLRFYLSPRARVWRKGETIWEEIGEGKIEFVTGEEADPAVLSPPAVAGEYSPLGLLIGFWIVLSLSTLIVYAAKGD